MKAIFQIKDLEQIYAILDSASYGTLALSKGVVPYSVPVNFARDDKVIYIHGSKSGKKMRYLDVNKNVSFSVVQEGSLIPSYFSSKSGLACPATQFFSSVIIEGLAQIVQDFDEKTKALSLLMQKLQSEGGYKPLLSKEYKSAIDATAIIKITPYSIGAKAKYGQNLPKERFEMVLQHLSKRGTSLDKQTIQKMKDYYGV